MKKDKGGKVKSKDVTRKISCHYRCYRNLEVYRLEDMHIQMD